MSNDLRKFLRQEVLREWYRIPITESETSEEDDDESGSVDEDGVVDEALRAISSDQIQAMMDTAELKNPENGSEMTLDDARAHFLRLWDRYSNDDIRAIDDDGNDREAFEQDARMTQILKFASGRDEDERWQIGTVLNRDGSPAEAEEAPSIEPTPKGEDVLNYPGDSKYEYKMEDDTWYTRQQGSERWISLAADRFLGTVAKLDAEAADNDDWPKRSDSAIADADDDSEEEETPGTTAASEEERAPAPDGSTVEHNGKTWEKKDTANSSTWYLKPRDTAAYDGDTYNQIAVQRRGTFVWGGEGADGLTKVETSNEGDDDWVGTVWDDLEGKVNEAINESSTHRWGHLAGLLQD